MYILQVFVWGKVEKNNFHVIYFKVLRFLQKYKNVVIIYFIGTHSPTSLFHRIVHKRGRKEGKRKKEELDWS